MEKQCNKCKLYKSKNEFEAYGHKRGICVDCEKKRQIEKQKKNIIQM